MTRFLARVESMSQEEAGAKIGMSGERIRGYRLGEWTRLNARTRRAMEEYLGFDVPDPNEQWRAGVRFAVNRLEDALRELEEVLDAVARNEDRPAPPTKPPRAQ